jgi:hypothetical protein
VINGSVTVYRRVGGLYKGSEKRSGVLKEGIVRIGVRGLKVGSSIKVCIHVYKLLVNYTKT